MEKNVRKELSVLSGRLGTNILNNVNSDRNVTIESIGTKNNLDVKVIVQLAMVHMIFMESVSKHVNNSI